MKSLTEAAKKAIVEKALNNKNKTMGEIADENNVARSTLSKWIRKYKGESASTKPVSRAVIAHCLIKNLTEQKPLPQIKSYP